MTDDDRTTEVGSEHPPAPVMDDGGRINRAATEFLRQGMQGTLDRSAARQDDVGAEEAARVAGSEAVEADTERRRIEAEAEELATRAPGSQAAQDAKAAADEAETLADDAINASLDSDAAAEDAHHKSGFIHHDHVAVGADYRRAEGDVARASRDLADLDRLQSKVEKDEALLGDSGSNVSGG